MSKAFYLIAGARLSEPMLSEVLSQVNPADLAALTDNLYAAVQQPLAELPYDGATHHVWLWRALTGRTSFPHEAPWLWLDQGGPQLATEIWSMTPFTQTNDGLTALQEPLSERDFDDLTMSIASRIEQEGFRLQLWDNHWFLTRKADWALVATPASALQYQHINPANDKELERFLIGPSASAAKTLLSDLTDILRQHPVNCSRKEKGQDSVDLLWIWGGGHEELFFPPTLFRSVAADNSALRGWANAAGILKERLCTTQRNGWPDDTPPGDVIVVIDDLQNAWLKGDAQAWCQALPTVIKKVQAFKSAAAKRDCRETLIVVCGRTHTATLHAGKAQNLLGRLFKPKPLALQAWLKDNE